jgi:predicted acetyltransferase
MKIRKSKEIDIPQLEKLFLVTRQQTFNWEKPDKFKLTDYKNATEGETVFVAEEDNGEVIGFVSVWEKDTHPFIHHLFIAPDHQKKGIGALLIRNLFAWLPLPYRLKCVLKNQDALAFYLKNKWLEIDRGIGEDGEYVLLELPAYQSLSNINIVRAHKEDKATIQNLGRFYVYEMSRYCGFLPTWETPSNGLFQCIDLSSYCEQADRYAFLIKVDDELAGFVLINKVGSTPDVDWNIGEFFIVSKFQGKGVGGYVAEQVFNQFPGIWETSQIPENTAAIEFWDKVVNRYSHGQFEKALKIVPEPKPHPMIVLTFSSRGTQCPSQI